MSAWLNMKAAFEAAVAAEDVYERDTWGPAFEREMANAADPRNAGIPEPSFRVTAAQNSEIEHLQDIRCDAEDALVSCPAPDLASTIWKIEYARARWSDFEDWPPSWWESVLSDLRRFASASQQVSA